MSLIDEMKAYAEREGLPILRDSEVPLFESIIANKRPGKVLEIGTCIGYSALRMAPFLGDGGTITTVEFDKARWQKAKDFIDRSPYKDVITPLLGDGTELSETLLGPGLSRRAQGTVRPPASAAHAETYARSPYHGRQHRLS